MAESRQVERTVIARLPFFEDKKIPHWHLLLRCHVAAVMKLRHTVRSKRFVHSTLGWGVIPITEALMIGSGARPRSYFRTAKD